MPQYAKNKGCAFHCPPCSIPCWHFGSKAHRLITRASVNLSSFCITVIAPRLSLANRQCFQANTLPLSVWPLYSLLCYSLHTLPSSSPALRRICCGANPWRRLRNSHLPLKLQRPEPLLALPCISPFMFQYVVSQSFFHQGFFSRCLSSINSLSQLG